MDDLQLVQLDNHDRTKVLEKLGYSISDNGFVIDSKTKKEVVCKYTKKGVHINTAAILPGSNLIINATPLTMAQYFVDYNKDGR